MCFPLTTFPGWIWSAFSIYYCIHIVYCRCVLSNWNKLIPNIYIRIGVAMPVCWMLRYYYSLLLKCTTVNGTGFGCVCYFGVEYNYVFISLIPLWSAISSGCLRLLLGFWCPFYIFWTTYLGFLKLCSFGSVATHLPGFFCPWIFSVNIGLSISPSNSFVSCLDSRLGYSTWEFQALQLIALAVFGAVD